MVKLTLILLGLATCDLIGYNRLGNNIFTHNGRRRAAKVRYGFENAQTGRGKSELVNRILEEFGNDIVWARRAIRKRSNQNRFRNVRQQKYLSAMRH